MSSAHIIKNGGWHLSYFGDINFIKNKINNFAHQEFNNNNFTDIKKIEERVKKCSDLYDRKDTTMNKISIKDNKYLPYDYEKYLSKFYE